MPILSIQTTAPPGLVGVFPEFVYLTTDDTIETITTPGYVDGYAYKLQGFSFNPLQLAFVNSSDQSVQICHVQVQPQTGVVTLSNIISADGVTEVTASGNIASSGGTTPNITFVGQLPVANGGTGLSSTVANQILFSSATSVISGIPTANNAVMVTSAGGVPSISSTLPSGITLVAPVLGTPASGTLTNCTGYPAGSISGIVPLANGGTNANLTADEGGVFYSTATGAALVGSITSPGCMLRSGSNAAPSWSVAQWPSTTTVSQLLYSSSNNTIEGLATASNAILVTNGSGVPVISDSLGQGLDVSNSQLTVGGTNNILFNTGNGFSDLFSNGLLAFSGQSGLENVNYSSISNSLSGEGPYLIAVGTDPDITYNVSGKGAAGVILFSNSGADAIAEFTSTTNAVNYFSFMAQTTGNSIVLSSKGSDPDINIAFIPKGNGLLQFGNTSSFTANGSGGTPVFVSTLPNGTVSPTVFKWLTAYDGAGNILYVPVFH